MSVTETRPAEADAADVTPAAVVAPTGLAGWLTTADHKRIGRLWIGAAVVFLVVGAVVGGIVGAEQASSGFEIADGETFGQVYTLHGEVSVFLFLVPLFLGLATYLVPLQLGASDIAYPRGSALAFWSYLVAGGLLLGAYAANGGPGGGSEVGVDLYLLALIALNAATCAALVSILATVLALRAPGMTLLRTPLFSWSVLVGGGLTLLTAPVLVARLVVLYVEHHFGGTFGDYGAISWFWSVPQVYLLAVPAAGVAAEIVPVLARSRLRMHEAGVVVLGLMGVLGIGAWAQVPATFDDLLFVAVGLAAVIPALALVGLLADAVRRGRPSPAAPLLLAAGAVVSLLLGAAVGATSVIDPLDLQGTVWETAQVHFTLYGGATLAAFAALWFWAPKIWGVHLGEGAGRATFALTFLGALLLATPHLVNGLFENVALADPVYDDDALAVTMNVISAVGGVLGILGILVAFGDLLGKVGRRRGTPATDNPWEGSTLEWATSSPPPPGNFDTPPPAVTSATPLAPDPVDAARAGPSLAGTEGS